MLDEIPWIRAAAIPEVNRNEIFLNLLVKFKCFGFVSYKLGPLMVSEGHTTYQIGVVSWGIGTSIYPYNFFRQQNPTSKKKRVHIFIIILTISKSN